LIAAFQRWGLPKAIRTDNGEPFGVPSHDAVPILSLWLIAWGIQPILNRPRRPQDNAKVERNQGTAGCWAEVDNCPNIETLQARLDQVADFQRNHYRVKKIGNVSRTTLFKDLLQTNRPFDETAFDETKAYEYLAKAIYPRKVSSGGTICIHSKHFQAGFQYRSQIVFVKFDASSKAWMVLDSNQKIIKMIPDERFSKENLFNLTVCQ
jgi:transposase InsO family protein